MSEDEFDDDEVSHQLEEDEILARQIYNDFQMELEQEEAIHEQELLKAKQSELEQNRRLREEQDLEYKQALEAAILPLKSIIPVEIENPPIHYICPISNQIMDNPICDNSDNVCYEKSVFLKYLRDHDNKNPDEKYVDKTKLSINNNLKSEIALWKRENPQWQK